MIFSVLKFAHCAIRVKERNIPTDKERIKGSIQAFKFGYILLTH